MKSKLIRITTVPISLEKLLEGQLSFMKDYYDVIAISAQEEKLKAYGEYHKIPTKYVALTRKITPLKDVQALFTLYTFLRKTKPQIVHTHTPKAGVVGMLAAYLAKVPHRLHTVAGLPLMEATGLKRRILNAVERLTYHCATKVYPNSKGLKDFILNEKFTKARKLKIIGNGSSNGIDTDHFDPSRYSFSENEKLRTEIGIGKDDFLFVFVGRLVGDKGINELVDAFSKLQVKQAHASLLLVGDFESDLDPLLPETLAEIHRNPKIYPVGFQNDVRPYFAISNALAFPSYREGFPNVVMQAGAMGLPAIVSNINGCNEIIKQGINGLIIESKNPLDLEKAMGELMNENDFFNRLKSGARNHIVHHYNREELWSAILKEYQSLV